jgi:hypothetical protein
VVANPDPNDEAGFHETSARVIANPHRYEILASFQTTVSQLWMIWVGLICS